MSNELIDVVSQLGRLRILVLGDLILDRYVWGDADRISQEAPVILLREERQETRLGGAANVANMLRGLDADVTLAGVVGDDLDGRTIRAHLQAAGVECAGLIADESRPTTVKERFIGRAQHRHPHQMLRVDREVHTPLNDQVTSLLLAAILPRLADYQAVLISDYAKGVCTPAILSRLIGESRRAKVPVIVDPASSADYRHYASATAVTPNRLETSRATGRTIESAEDAFEAGRILCRQLQLKHAFVTLDRDGIALVRAQGEAELFPTRRREVYDITGAGDMVLAMIGVGTAAGVAAEHIARLANVAGGLEVEQIGVVTITREEILADLMKGASVLSAPDTRSVRGTTDRVAAQRGGPKGKVCGLEDLSRHIAARKKLGQRIVFTNGCFDLLHPGHVSYLQEAASLGHCLIVAINDDAGVRRHKGHKRPLIPQEHRASMLAALECVDFVHVFREETPHEIIGRLQPDLLVKGGTTPVVVGSEIVEAYGGEVRRLDALDGFSTTNLVGRIRNLADAA